MSKRVSGYLSWDLDGCLWDSDLAHYLAVNEALQPYGTRITEEEHLSTFKGLPTLRKCEMLTQMKRLPRTAHQDVAIRKQSVTLHTIQQTVQPRPEVTALLSDLREAGWRQCCCSNSIRETVQRVLLGMEILDFFDFYLSNEDVERAKPAPDIFLKAASLYHINPLQMVAIEDADAGKMAVHRAGCKLVAVTGPQEVGPGLIHRILTKGREIERLNQAKILPTFCCDPAVLGAAQ